MPCQTLFFWDWESRATIIAVGGHDRGLDQTSKLCLVVSSEESSSVMSSRYRYPDPKAW